MPINQLKLHEFKQYARSNNVLYLLTLNIGVRIILRDWDGLQIYKVIELICVRRI